MHQTTSIFNYQSPLQVIENQKNYMRLQKKLHQINNRKHSAICKNTPCFDVCIVAQQGVKQNGVKLVKVPSQTQE